MFFRTTFFLLLIDITDSHENYEQGTSSFFNLHMGIELSKMLIIYYSSNTVTITKANT